MRAQDAPRIDRRRFHRADRRYACNSCAYARIWRTKALPVSAGAVQNLIGELDLPQHIADYGIGEPELKTAASELAGKYPEEDLLKIYLAAL